MIGGEVLSKLSKAIDRFCYKHPRFGINNLMLYIVAGNVIVYLFAVMDQTGNFLSYLYFNPALILKGQVWRLITFIFIPSSGGVFYTVLKLYLYYFIGSSLEREWGPGKFTIYYFSGVLLSAIYGLVAGAVLGSYALYFFDSSFVNLSMYFAFAVLFPDTYLRVFFIFPIKVTFLAIIAAAYFVVEMVMLPFPEMLLPLIAILNFFIFCGADLIQLIRPSVKSKRKASYEFKAKVRTATYEQNSKEYRNKCSVCGKTDTEYPDLEFRYCSRCDGYHCFCAEHINNHEHFK